MTRDGAREEAHRELSKSIYQGHEPSWWSRPIGWINDRLEDLFRWLVPHDGRGPGDTGGLGVLALVLVLAVAVVALRWWLGPVRRTARSKAEVQDLSSPLSAAELRAEADEYAGQGAYAEAVRSRLRAIVRMLEEKGVLDPRPGRTAGELVEEVARIAPTPPGPPAGDGPTAALARAVEVFSEIWYGGRTASASGYQAVVDADDALARMRRGAGATVATESFEVPA